MWVPERRLLSDLYVEKQDICRQGQMFLLSYLLPDVFYSCDVSAVTVLPSRGRSLLSQHCLQFELDMMALIIIIIMFH